MEGLGEGLDLRGAELTSPAGYANGDRRRRGETQMGEEKRALPDAPADLDQAQLWKVRNRLHRATLWDGVDNESLQSGEGCEHLHEHAHPCRGRLETLPVDDLEMAKRGAEKGVVPGEIPVGDGESMEIGNVAGKKHWWDLPVLRNDLVGLVRAKRDVEDLEAFGRSAQRLAKLARGAICVVERKVEVLYFG